MLLLSYFYIPVVMENDLDSWDPSVLEDEKGFELEHGCAVLFDLFHNCSCNLLKKIIFC